VRIIFAIGHVRHPFEIISSSTIGGCVFRSTAQVGEQLAKRKSRAISSSFPIRSGADCLLVYSR
jgi:hypothetical protein